MEFQLFKTTQRTFTNVTIEDVSIRNDEIRFDLIRIVKQIGLFNDCLTILHCKSSSEDIIQILDFFPSLRKLVIEETEVSGTGPKNWRLNRLSFQDLKIFHVIRNNGKKVLDSDYLLVMKAFKRNTLKELKFNGSGSNKILIEALHNQKSIESLDIGINGNEVPDLSSLRLKQLTLSIRDYDVNYSSVLRAIRCQPGLECLNVSNLLVYPLLFLDIVVLENLQHLDICLSEIPSEFIKFFNAFQLKTMSVRSVRSDYVDQISALSEIRNENLKFLDLDFPEITKKVMEKFAINNPNVISVIVSTDKNANKTFEALFESFHNVEEIDILRTEKTLDFHLFVDLQNLCDQSLIKRRLNTLFTTKIAFDFNEKSLRNFLLTMPRLEHLSIKDNSFTEKDIEVIVRELPILKTLELDRCTGNADSVFAILCEHGNCLVGVELYGLEFIEKTKLMRNSRFRTATLRSDRTVMHLLSG